jgi:hypothetical protein
MLDEPSRPVSGVNNYVDTTARADGTVRLHRRYGKLWPTLAEVPRTRPRRWPRIKLSDLKYDARYLGYHTSDNLLRFNWPYGRWVCCDGRVVLFNRKYQPIIERRTNGGWQQSGDPFEWVRNIEHEDWFAFDGNAAWHNQGNFDRLQAVLQELLPDPDELLGWLHEPRPAQFFVGSKRRT